MNKTIDKKTIRKGLLPYLFLALIILTVFYVVNVMNNDVNVLTYNEFMSDNTVRKTDNILYRKNEIYDKILS